MIILLVIFLLFLFLYFCQNRELKEKYDLSYKHRNKYANYTDYKYNPYRHFLNYRYNTGYNYPYYYPIYTTYPELNEENCRKYYPCDKE